MRSAGSAMSGGAHRFCAVLYAVLVLGLVPGFMLATSPAPWHGSPLVIVALELVATSIVFGEVALKRAVPVQFDGLIAVIVLLLITGGPFAAFAGFLLPDLVGRLILRRHRFLTPGFGANIAAYGWATLAGASVLSLSGAHGAALAPVAFAATLAMMAVSFVLARLLFGTLWQRYTPRALIAEEYVALVPVHLALGLLAAAATAMFAFSPGAGVSVLAVAALVPSALLPWLAHFRDVRELELPDAAALYVRALARQLQLPRDRLPVALAAARLIVPPRPSGRTRRTGLALDLLRGALADDASLDRLAMRSQSVVRQVQDRWDGTDRPNAYAPGSLIDIESRVLAVAVAWARLTAAGGLQLEQAEAMLSLEIEAATRLDPWVVHAAGEIITTEAQFARLASFQPRLALLPVPRRIRRELLPWALRAYA